MILTVSITQNGKTIASQTIANPQPGDVEAVIHQLLFGLRRAKGGPIGPFQIDVR